MTRFVKKINDSPLAAERAEKDILGNKIDTTYQRKLTAGSNISINEVTNTISAQVPPDFSSVIPSDASSSNKLVSTNTLDARLANFGGFKEVQGTGADLHPNVPSGEENSKLIYLVRDNSATGDDKYKEWIWDSGDLEANPPVSAQWKLIGDTTMNLDGKADKVQNATAGNFASLDSSGNLNDSGNKAADFASAMHNHGNIASDGKSTSEPTSTTKFLRADGSWQVPERSDGHSVWYRNTSWTASQLMNQYVGKSTTWDNTDSYELKTLKAGDTIKIYVTVTNMANAHFVMDLKVTEVDSVAPTATVMAIYQADQNEVLDGTDADANNFIIPGNYILQNVTQVTKNWPGTSSGSLDFTNLCVTRLVRNDASSPFSASIDIQQSVRWSARQLYRTKVNGTWGLWKIIPMGNVNYYEAIGSSTQPVYVDTIGRLVACDDPWNYIKTKIYNGSLGSANRPVYWTGSNLALSKPSPNADLMGTVGNTTAAGARADTDQLENTTINCNNGSVRYLNAMKFISNVPYTFLIPSVNASKSALVTSTAMTVYQIGASSFSLGTNATFYLDKAGGTSTQHEIVFAYRVGTSLYIFHQY